MALKFAVGVSPEDDAMAPVLEWIKSSNLLSTVRFYGGNIKPMPSRLGTPYGYGMCATIPDGITIPKHLKEMVLPGGLYTLCLEEHIRNNQPDGCGNEYYLILLEPVKAI